MCAIASWGIQVSVHTGISLSNAHHFPWLDANVASIFPIELMEVQHLCLSRKVYCCTQHHSLTDSQVALGTYWNFKP